MTRYLVRRLIEMVITVILASILIFGILNFIPGGPFDAQLQTKARNDPGYLDRVNRLIGLDKPLHERYLIWAGKILRGDFGNSWVVQTGKPVGKIIFEERLPNTLQLMVTSLVISTVIALVIGVLSAIKQYSVLDYFVTGFSYFGLSMPVFWLALVLIMIFSLQLRWLPVAGMYDPGKQHDLLNRLEHLVLPVTVLSLLQIAGLSRYVRSSLLEVLRQDYVRTARAKGLPERLVLNRHALRNGLIPVITIMALQIPGLVGGATITETIFAWPGMGRLLYDAVLGADFPIAQAVLVIIAGLVVLSNLLADLAYAAVDPRIRYE